jgi:hypothetical protein
MRVNFKLSFYHHISRLHTIKVSHNIHTMYKTFEEYKKRNLQILRLGSPRCLQLGFYMGYIHWGIHHMHLRIFKKRGLVMKKTSTFVLPNIFTIKKTQICHGRRLLHKKRIPRLNTK